MTTPETVVRFTHEQMLAILAPTPIAEADCITWLRGHHRKIPPVSRALDRESAFNEARAGLAEQEQGWLAKFRAMANKWLERGDGLAIYRNEAMDSAHFGMRVYMSFGSHAAQIEAAEPPEKMPDIGRYGTPWAYCLEATYKGEAL